MKAGSWARGSTTSCSAWRAVSRRSPFARRGNVPAPERFPKRAGAFQLSRRPDFKTLSLYWVADVRGYRAWCRPLVIYGRNAILVFVASGLLAKTLALVKMNGPDGVAVSPQALLYRTTLASWLPPHPASLAYAVANVLFWFVVLRELDRREIYLKV